MKRQEFDAAGSVLDLTERERAGLLEARAKGIDPQDAVGQLSNWRRGGG